MQRKPSSSSWWGWFAGLVIVVCAPGVLRSATVEILPDRVVLRSDQIERTISLASGIARTTQIVHVPTKTTLDLADEGPHIRLISSKEIPGSKLRISGEVTTDPPAKGDKARRAAQGPRVVATIPVACTIPASIEARVHVEVTDGLHVTRKWCDVRAGEPVDAIQVEQLAGTFKPHLGGHGQPLYINGQWFAGLEYPAGYHSGSKDHVRLYHFPGKKRFTSKRAVWGANAYGRLDDSFEAYLSRIRKKPRGLLQYNSWYDLRGPELAVDTLLSRYAEFRKALLEPYGLRLDAVVPDDGWQNPQSVWDVNRKVLPHGYKPLAEALAKTGSRVGLWLPLNGAGLDTAWGAKQGYEKSDQGAYYCLAGPKVHQAIRQATEARIRDANLAYYKHDLNWLRCSAKGHGHLPSARHGFEANVDALIDLLAFERKTQPEIFLNLASGMWLSPWWLMHADTVWMGGDEFGYDKHHPQLTPREWAMSYRDQNLHARLRGERAAFPVSAMMMHGIIHGRHNRLGGPDETLGDWSDYVVMHLARGVMLKELYLTPSLLNAQGWDVLGRATCWARRHAPTMVHTRMVGGEPRQGQLYGYVHWAADKGILALRNPGPAEQIFKLTTGERPGWLAPLPAEASTGWDVRTVYPYHKLLNERLASSSGIELRVPGASVFVWEIDPPGRCPPMPRGLRVLEDRAFCDERHVAAEIGVQPGSTTQSAQPAGTQPATVTRPSMTLRFTLPTAKLSRADVLIIVRGETTSPVGKLTVNGKSARIETVSGDDWHMSRIDCIGRSGEVVITAPVTHRAMPFVFSPPTLEAWLMVELPLTIRKEPTSKPATTTAASRPSTAAATTASKPTAAATTTAATAPAAKPPPPSTTTTASAPTTQGAIPLPRPYRPSALRRSFCLLEPTPVGPPGAASTVIKPDELAKIQAAKLRIELHDADGGAYADKHILLNGQPLAKVPVNQGEVSRWQEHVIDLPKEWLGKLKMTNAVVLTNKPHDLFKFRGVALAVRKADGSWVTSSRAGQVYASSRNWRYTEGEVFEGDRSPEIAVSFKAAK